MGGAGGTGGGGRGGGSGTGGAIDAGCVPEQLVVTCVNRQCGPTVNNCGTTVTCPNMCTGSQICENNAQGPKCDNPPVITATSSSTALAELGGRVSLSCTGTDVDGDPLTYAWTTTAGTLTDAAAQQTMLVAPTTKATVTVTCTASDGHSGSASKALSVQVVVGPTTGLLGLHEFDGNLGDTSGNLNNGTLVAGTSMFTADRSGAAGQALNFDGTTTVGLPNEASFDLTALSITAFVRTPDPATQPRVIVSKALTGFGNFTLAIDLMGTATPAVHWIHDIPGPPTGAIFSVQAPLGVAPSAYFHVAATLDATALRLYINGAQVLVSANPTAPILNNTPVLIGRGTTGMFLGAIDSLRIYNRVLTAQEIAAIAADR